jgi:murein DD-endopeptidase MepM/ murein hydrolase activator NlpD
MSARTLSIDTPHMSGQDVTDWQETLAKQFRVWKVDYPLVIDGDYGVATRAGAATALYGLGIDTGEMEHGVTPALRIKVRNKKLSAAESGRYLARSRWRARLRKKHAAGGRVAPPLARIITDTWGYHPGVHDGIDLICAPNATIYALCDARVIDVRAGGWWGKAPSGDKSLGDGIIQLECLTDTGPFKKGMHFGYGHAEHAIVRRGQVVKAGTPLGKAGLAVAWHVHFMVNGGGTTKGIGDRNPRPFVDYAMAQR